MLRGDKITEHAHIAYRFSELIAGIPIARKFLEGTECSLHRLSQWLMGV